MKMTPMDRRTALTVFVALAALTLFGCKKETRTTGPARAAASSVADKRYKIAVIGKSSTNPVFLAARTGAEAAAKKISREQGIEIEIAWMTPPQEDGQVQAQRVAQAVNEGAQAVLISCSDAGKVTGAINDAVARGVPVMTFDSDAAGSRRFAFYGVDDVDIGQHLMGELAQLMQDKGKVAILAGNQNAPNLRKRVEGVTQEAAKHPQIKIIGTFYHVETPQDAAAEVVRVMNAYPEVNGWAMVGGWPLFTKSLLTDLDPKKVKVAAVDGLAPQLPYVDKGIAPVLLAQPVYLWGSVGVEKIIDKIHFHRDVPAVIPMQPVRVTRETLGAWARQLQGWGFSDVPPEYLSR
jgi:ribose transport system substrate-binding protein